MQDHSKTNYVKNLNEPGELSQWLCHDDSTINIVLELLLLLLLLLLLGYI